jgi:hypothetical protein
MEGSSGLDVFPIMIFGNWGKAKLPIRRNINIKNLTLNIGDPEFALKLRKNQSEKSDLSEIICMFEKPNQPFCELHFFHRIHFPFHYLDGPGR